MSTEQQESDSQESTHRPKQRWQWIPDRPSPQRIAFVCVGLIVVSVVVALLPLDSATPAQRVLSSLLTAIAWGYPVGWSAMQGPRRMKGTIGGLALGILLLMSSSLALFCFSPHDFGPMRTVITLDLPSLLISTALMWSVLRIASLVSGIEIVRRDTPIARRWSIRRWMYLIFVVAVLIQFVLVYVRWSLSILYGNADVLADPTREVVNVQSVLMLSSVFTIPFVATQWSGWIMAGRYWRWCLLPIAIVCVGAWSYLGTISFPQKMTANGIQVQFAFLPKDLVLTSVTQLAIYCVGASLVPWMGYRWIDYWSTETKKPVSESDS